MFHRCAAINGITVWLMSGYKKVFTNHFCYVNIPTYLTLTQSLDTPTYDRVKGDYNN